MRGRGGSAGGYRDFEVDLLEGVREVLRLSGGLGAPADHADLLDALERLRDERELVATALPKSQEDEDTLRRFHEIWGVERGGGGGAGIRGSASPRLGCEEVGGHTRRMSSLEGSGATENSIVSFLNTLVSNMIGPTCHANLGHSLPRTTQREESHKMRLVRPARSGFRTLDWRTDERSASFGPVWPGAKAPAGIAEKASAVASTAETAAARIRVFDMIPMKNRPPPTCRDLTTDNFWRSQLIESGHVDFSRFDHFLFSGSTAGAEVWLVGGSWLALYKPISKTRRVKKFFPVPAPNLFSDVEQQATGRRGDGDLGASRLKIRVGSRDKDEGSQSPRLQPEGPQRLRLQPEGSKRLRLQRVQPLSREGGRGTDAECPAFQRRGARC